MRWLCLAAALLLAGLLSSCGEGGGQSRECAQMLNRLDGCPDVDESTRRLYLQSGYEEDGACWDDPDFAEVCTNTCISIMERWDDMGICP